MKKLIATFILNLITIFMWSSLSFAQNNETVTTTPSIVPETKTTLRIPHKNENISEGEFVQQALLPGITSTIIALAGGLALVFVIVGGLQMLSSFGNPDAFAKGKKTVMWALIGVVISILSYAIVAIIANIKI